MLRRAARRRAESPDAFEQRRKAFALPVVVVPLADMKRWRGEPWTRGDSKRFVLLSELDVASLSATPGRTGVTAAPGFVTDFASIPFPVSSVMKPIGRYAQAALIHDWGYYTHPEGWKKRDWDLLFYLGMKAQGVPRRRAWLMWKAVAWFGLPAWRSGPKKPNKMYGVEELVAKVFDSNVSPGSTDGPPDPGPIMAV